MVTDWLPVFFHHELLEPLRVVANAQSLEVGHHVSLDLLIVNHGVELLLVHQHVLSHVYLLYLLIQ